MSRRKDIIRVRAEINEIEYKKMILMINDSKSWFFDNKVNMIDKDLTRVIKKKEKGPNV